MATGRFGYIWPSAEFLGPGDHEAASKTVEYEVTVHGQEPVVVELPLGEALVVDVGDEPTLVRYRIKWAQSPEYHDWCPTPYPVRADQSAR